MADLDVEKKKNNDWWKWLVGILALIIIVWLIIENTGDDTEEIEEVEPTTSVQPAPENEKDELVYAARF